jgi:hypothetical protein
MVQIKQFLVMVIQVQDTSITNLVSNLGVVGTDVTGVGTARNSLAATMYGGDKAIFAYGWVSSGATTTSIKFSFKYRSSG